MKLQCYSGWIPLGICLILLSQPIISAAANTSEAAAGATDFYAFCFDIHDAEKRSLDEQAQMLKRLGFDGAGHVGPENIQQRAGTLKQAGLRLYLAGMRLDLNEDIAAAVEELKKALPVLRDQRALVYVTLAGLPTSDPSGQQPAVAALRQLAAVAKPANVRLGIYPHTSDWVAHADHAVRVAEAVDRDNVGVIFNLCHFLRNDDLSQLEEVLTAAGDRLFGVTINGAELAGKNDTDWSRLIEPLDQGDFDVKRLLSLLDHVGYDGPVGLMCYGIGGDAAQHLERSIAAWQKLNAE